MIDYTNSQTKIIEEVPGAASTHDAEKYSEQAELAYRNRWGIRNKFNHVKASSMSNGVFHFSKKWCSFFRFPNNITVFYSKSNPVGWLFHKDIHKQLTPCPFGGFDFQNSLNPIEEYNPNNAS